MALPSVAEYIGPSTGLAVTVDNTGGCDALLLIFAGEHNTLTDISLTQWVDNSGTPQEAEFVGREVVDNGSNRLLVVEMWKVASPASVNTTWTATATGTFGHTHQSFALRLDDVGSAVAELFTSDNFSSTTVSGNSITTTGADRLLVSAGAHGFSTFGATADSGQTVYANSVIGSGVAGYCPWIGTLAAASAGTHTVEWSHTSAYTVSCLVAIVPAGGTTVQLAGMIRG